MKEVIDRLDFIKMYNVCSVKHSVKRIGKQATSWKKIFREGISDKGLLLIIYGELQKLNNNNKNPQQHTLKMDQRSYQTLHQRGHPDDKHMKRCFR